ncbi:MAG: MMPL family transporter [Acidimicrobiales bacterium]|nr:MMPL family transporter [Acidimicrobiales bacterium]
MRNFWSWLGLNLGKRAGIVALVGLLVTMGLGIGMVKLKFVTSNASYLNQNDLAQQENANFEKVFGGDPMASMITMNPGSSINNLFTPANQAAMNKIETELDKDPSVFRVVTPMDVMHLSQNLVVAPGGPVYSIAGSLLLYAYQHDLSPSSQKLRLANLSGQLKAEEAIPASKQVFTNPNWVNFLTHNTDGSLRQADLSFFPNNSHAVIFVFLQGGLNIDQESQAAARVTSIINSNPISGATVITTGVPALLKTINDYLKGGMFTLTGIAAILMILILLLTFTVRWRLLPFIVVGIGLVWAFGIAGYFNIPLTLASIAGLPVLLGVGIDYAVQMHSRIEEEVVLDRAAHPIQATARNLGPALLVVTFDAVFAFTALLVAKVPMIRQFGALLVVGIIAVCIGSIIGPLAILGVREYRSPTKGKDFSKGYLSRLTVYLGSLPATAAIPLAAVSLVIFFSGIAVEGKLQLQTDPIQWVNPNSQAIKNIVALRAGTGSDDLMGVLVTTKQPFTDQTVKYVTNLTNEIQSKYSNVIFPGIGLVNFIEQFMAVPGADQVVPTGQQVLQVYGVTPTAIQKLTVENSGADMSIIFRAKTETLSGLQPLVQELQGPPVVTTPVGMTAAPGGIAVVGVGLLENLAASRTVLTYLSILLVGAFLTVRLRSLIRAVLSLIPVTIAVGAVSLIAYALNLQLSPMTSIAGPLVVAVCTEFTSLILLRFVEERARGLEPREAMNVTAARTGRAFMVSAMTAIAGIGVMAFSSMPLLRGFGIIVAMNVAVALLCALIILPPILVLADKRNWVSGGLIKIPEPPRVVEVNTDEPEIDTAGVFA